MTTLTLTLNPLTTLPLLVRISMPSPFSTSSNTSSSPSSTSHCLMDRRCIEELRFDVPLISTRRVSTPTKSTRSDPNANQAYSPDTSRSVPFLWERAPGVPKDSTPRNAEEVFTPRPPPGRWRPPSYLNESTNDDANYSTSDASLDTDRFSDALEKISLSESLGIPCRLSVSRDAGPGVTRAPSFIMNRFLPAANALAASSAASASPKYSNYRRSREPTKLGRGRRLIVAEAARKIGAADQQYYADHAPPAASLKKACGIMLLFPWSMKRAVCGLERPVRCQTPRMTSLEDFPAHRSKKSATNVSGMGSDDALSSKAWKSPGWGLPFLDTSRILRRKEKSNRGFTAAERGSPRRRDGRRGVVPDIGRPLPVLKTPSEPWLANALNSVNRGRRH